MKPLVDNPTWGIAQAAAYLGCTPNTLRVWVQKRRIPFVRVGALVRFRKADLDSYLDEHAVPVAATKK